MDNMNRLCYRIYSHHQKVHSVGAYTIPVRVHFATMLAKTKMKETKAIIIQSVCVLLLIAHQLIPS